VVAELSGSEMTQERIVERSFREGDARPDSASALGTAG
jgi:hypothetical protein